MIKIFTKGYISKSNLGYIQEFPVPDDLENWIETDIDPTFNYKGKIYNIDTGEFDAAPLNNTQLKALGVEIQGHMISLSESNQNGLSAISTMVDKAILLELDPFPIYPYLETKDGKAKLTANNQQEFDSIFLTFGLARQQFFS